MGTFIQTIHSYAEVAGDRSENESPTLTTLLWTRFALWPKGTSRFMAHVGRSQTSQLKSRHKALQTVCYFKHRPRHLNTGTAPVALEKSPRYC